MPRPHDGLFPILAADDELGKQRIVVRGYLITAVQMCIEPNTRSTRGVERRDRARTRCETA